MRKNIFFSILLVISFSAGIFFEPWFTPIVEGAPIVRGVYSPRRLVTVPCLCSASVAAVMGPTRPAVVNIYLTMPYPLRSWYQMYTGAKGAGVVLYVPSVCSILTPIGCVPLTIPGTAFLDGSAVPI